MNLTLSHPVQLAAIGCILASQSHAQCTIQDLTGSSASVGDRFGSDVALDGGLAIVGAENDDTLGANSGAAYVYDLASGLAVEEAKLLASDGTASDHFGLDVAIDGDVAIVGAPGLYTGVSGPGAAYVFRRIGGTWIEEQILVPSGSENDDNFGYSIALDGGRALIGAPHWGNGDAAVYVFELVGSSWTEVQELIPGDIGFGDAFGEELALDGDRILISSPFDNLGGLSSAGSVYVYEETGGLWSQAAKFTAVVPEAAEFFGHSLDLAGDLAFVGAPYGDGAVADVHVTERWHRSPVKPTTPSVNWAAVHSRRSAHDRARLRGDLTRHVGAGRRALLHEQRGRRRLRQRDQPLARAPPGRLAERGQGAHLRARGADLDRDRHHEPRCLDEVRLLDLPGRGPRTDRGDRAIHRLGRLRSDRGVLRRGLQRERDLRPLRALLRVERRRERERGSRRV